MDDLMKSELRRKVEAIAHTWGHGEWHHPADRAMLEGIMDPLNARYGAGSHWIEVIDNQEPK